MMISLAACLLVFCSGGQAGLIESSIGLIEEGNGNNLIESSGSQELIDKLTMLENKIANLETENENMKGLMKVTMENKIANLESQVDQVDTENKHMKDLLKVTVLRSCAEYSHYGIKTSRRYMIDPDGKLMGQEPFQVYCDLSKGATHVLHDTESLTEIDHCHDPGCYNKKISYINGLTSEPVSMNQVLSLMELSEYCEQDIRYDCTLAPLLHNGVNYAWWKDRHGEQNFYFTGSHKNEHVCDCHYSEDGCANAKLEKNTCNCNAYLPVQTSDTGTITNMSALPIMEMYAGGLNYQMEVGSFQIGRLKCYGEKTVEPASSCSSLKKTGVTTSGYYNIKTPGLKHVKLVFCDMQSDSYTDVPQVEEVSDSSPLGTILAWVPRPEASLTPEVLPDGWLPCDGTTITKGPWAGGKTPDLNSIGAFLRGSSEAKTLEMEERGVEDHTHNDPGHSHSCSANSHSSSHSHSYFTPGSSCPPGFVPVDGDVSGWGSLYGDISVSSRSECGKKCDGEGRCLSFEHSHSSGKCNLNTQKWPTTGNYRDYQYCSYIGKSDSITKSTTVSVSTSCSTGSRSSGIGGVTASSLLNDRHTNMKVRYVIRCW